MFACGLMNYLKKESGCVCLMKRKTLAQWFHFLCLQFYEDMNSEVLIHHCLVSLGFPPSHHQRFSASFVCIISSSSSYRRFQYRPSSVTGPFEPPSPATKQKQGCLFGHADSTQMDLPSAECLNVYAGFITVLLSAL